MAFTPQISEEMAAKLATLNPAPRPQLDSEEIEVHGSSDGQVIKAERVLTDQGYFVSSPALDWELTGPF